MNQETLFQQTNQAELRSAEASRRLGALDLCLWTAGGKGISTWKARRIQKFTSQIYTVIFGFDLSKNENISMDLY